MPPRGRGSRQTSHSAARGQPHAATTRGAARGQPSPAITRGATAYLAHAFGRGAVPTLTAPPAQAGALQPMFHFGRGVTPPTPAANAPPAPAPTQPLIDVVAETRDMKFAPHTKRNPTPRSASPSGSSSSGPPRFFGPSCPGESARAKISSHPKRGSVRLVKTGYSVSDTTARKALNSESGDQRGERKRPNEAFPHWQFGIDNVQYCDVYEESRTVADGKAS
ncbi:hypothetical protein B0H10DRAFT_2195739 [Mycena sp. CBHHK59/15]|nr:hypothetical protein B0H10DRAFT_2195739 [Mycena sp. CBHHK59/15]